MENSLKQRIVGAIVLIALAVIFLPAILKEKSKTAPFHSQIPEKPAALVENDVSEEVLEQIQQTRKTLDKLEANQRKSKQEVLSEEAPKKIENSDAAALPEKVVESKAVEQKNDRELEKAELETTKNNPDKRSPDNQVAKTEEAETIGPQFKDAAWVIQVASFSSKDNAVRMVEKLKKAGHKAYRRAGKNSRNKTIYRIFVGPFIEKSRAAKDLEKAAKITENKGILIPFDPTKH